MIHAWHKIYLAGPITGHTLGEARNWRAQATKLLEPATCIDPTRGIEKALGKIESGFRFDHATDVPGEMKEEPMLQPSFFVNRDINDMRRCSAMLANLIPPPRSAGTYVEIGIASEIERRDKDSTGIPIFAVVGQGKEIDDFVKSDFLKEVVLCTSPTLEKACEAIKEYLS